MTTESSIRPATAPGAPERTTDAHIQFVVCVVAGERYGIEVGRVHEIIRLTTITALPGVDRTFSGVINLRGRVIPVMDMRRRFGLPDADPTRLSRIVVADAGAAQIGLLVDAVDAVVSIDTSAIEPTPALTTGPAREHLTGIARATDGLIVVLDVDRLVDAAVTMPSAVPEPEASA